VRSRGAGRVAAVYVEEGQAVDFGAPLLAIDRSP
ncbi:MAG: biotin/lipoyl-binding protein, partial [Candidatus Eremiobacteraeota bacterium]|nr:biotin/lipoyl-binding protein [Candidatus Eremiobacteraeota bacterium]